MKKILAVLLCLAMVFSMVACGSSDDGGGSDATDDTTVYKITYAGTVADTAAITYCMVDAAEKMEEMSDGRLVMTVYPNNQLGDSVANFQQMQENGSVQMGEMSAAAMTSFTNLFTPFSLPFLFTSKEQAFNYYDNSQQIQEISEQLVADTGVRIVGWYYNDTRTLTNSKKAVSLPEDMKGLKIRVMESDVYLKTFEALGASPITMSFAEVFTGLQQGTIDGQDNGIVLTVSQKFHEVQKYYTDLGHVIDVAPILVSEEFYQSLPDDLKEILQECIDEAVANERASYLEEELEDIAQYCEITNLTDEQRTAFRDACAPVYDWYVDAYTDIDLDAIQTEIANYN